MEAALLQDATPQGLALSEARIATHDGYIWPLPRRRMQDREQILARMVEDVARLVAQESDEPCVTLDHLTACGWHAHQTQAHGALAFRRWEEAQAREERRLTGNRSTARRLIDWRREAAAYACFALPALIFARQMWGV